MQTSSIRNNKQINHFQNELKTKDKIIDQLLKSANSELESKNNIIHKLLHQTNDAKKKKSIQRQNDINSKSDIADNKSDEQDSFKSNKIIKEHTERTKANNLPNNIESRGVKPKTNKRKKILVEIFGN